ncbi:MAG: T9SS type A sorting domain-containing protein, partial [Paludibacter sp.]
ASAQPSDNPYKTQYGTATPTWTETLNWTQSVSIVNFKLAEETEWDNALQKAFDNLGANGGTVFFPAGTYAFLNNVVLPSKVILRGETPTQIDAKMADFAPTSRLVFPRYIPDFTGTGTLNSTAFKSITTIGDVFNCGIVYLDINRGRISLGSSASKNVLVYGVRQNNVAQPDAGVPDMIYMNGWQRFSYRHTYNISVFAETGGSVTRCRVNDLLNNTVNPIADDSYEQPGYIAKGTYINGADNPNGATAAGTTTITHGERARFDYLNHYGIKVNGKRMNPSVNAVPINQEIELVDNWVYTTMRVGYFAEAIGLVVRGNVKKDKTGKMAWLDATGKSLITYNGNTLENRALNFAGENILIENNDFEVYRHKMVNTKYYSTDGEGIMIQWQDAWGFNTADASSGYGARMRDISIRNNKVTGYIGIYDVQVPISNVIIQNNDLRANEDITGRTDGIIMVFKKETNHRVDKLLIENNTNIASINIGWKNTATNENEMPGANISVRNNVGVGRVGINVPYQAILQGNTGFTTTSTFTTDKLLPITQAPFQMQYNADADSPIFVEFKKTIEAIDLSKITIKRASDGLVSPLTASINANKLVLSTTTTLILNDADTITIPANSIKFAGETTVNAKMSWHFRIDENSSTGVSKIINNKTYSFFPNPVKDKITIHNNTEKPIMTKILSLSGVELKCALTSNGDEFNIKDLSKGVYVLKIGNTSHKLIKK